MASDGAAGVRRRAARVLLRGLEADAAATLSSDARIDRLELRRELARVRARWRLAGCVLLVLALGVAQWRVGPVFAVPLGIVAAALGVAWDRWQSASAEDERMEQDLRALTTVYHESPRTIRKWLTQEFIDDSIRNLLAAALDDEDMANGYWQQGVAPFLQESARGYKSRWHYQIVVADLAEQVALEVGGATVASLDPATHRRLHTTVDYEQRVPDQPEMQYVAVVFEGAELPSWFKRPGFLLRETVVMPEAFVASLPERDERLAVLPAAYPADSAVQAVNGPFATAARTVLRTSVAIGEEQIQPSTLYIDRSGICWGFRFTTEQRRRLQALCKVEVDLHTFMSREQRYFPVVIAAPTRNPTVQFNYSQCADVARVETEVFFSAERPWDARLRRHHEEDRCVDVQTQSSDWVFAGSGCIFAWWPDG